MLLIDTKSLDIFLFCDIKLVTPISHLPEHTHQAGGADGFLGGGLSVIRTCGLADISSRLGR